MFEWERNRLDYAGVAMLSQNTSGEYSRLRGGGGFMTPTCISGPILSQIESPALVCLGVGVARTSGFIDLVKFEKKNQERLTSTAVQGLK